MGSSRLKNLAVAGLLGICGALFVVSDWLAKTPQILSEMSSDPLGATASAGVKKTVFFEGNTARQVEKNFEAIKPLSSAQRSIHPAPESEKAPAAIPAATEVSVLPSAAQAVSSGSDSPVFLPVKHLAEQDSPSLNSPPVSGGVIASSGKQQAFVRWREVDQGENTSRASRHYLEIVLPGTLASKGNFVRAVSRVLLSRSSPLKIAPLAREPLDLSEEPFLLGWVKDAVGRDIRYPAQASAYARYLLEKTPPKYDDQSQYLSLKIPLDTSELPNKARPFREWVKRFSDQFLIPQALIYAVMEVESGFNVRAVSRSNALGLMQIKADAAGRDVYHLIDRRKGKPSHGELFNPQANIRMGTAYLSLLQNHYLKQIHQPKVRELVAIAAYNGGLSAALALFGKTEEEAIERLNRLSQRQIYRTLRFSHPAEETRGYIHKVLQAKNRYQRWLKNDEIRV
ncbi:murein transglycosylase domain-containing protein [Thiomicrorhabdus sp.]|uniref:murein transglycosylase domain-containing protein n=1 Tax=Thiomicrorhabdus sp. TaxID=2039724 RepID=UPI0029C90D32|nr:murein transglycosylase domain-containing protein [Thiomicrorhabdus sp.]